MHCYEFNVVLQEVPGEISLCFSISGCPLQCPGCHSPFLWKEHSGEKITPEAFEHTLNQYNDFATCVLFMGGEWHADELIELLKCAQGKGYKTCLYTGEELVESKILEYLTYIKTGPWIQDLGGLSSRNTNQIFREVSTNTVLNHLFIPK